MKTKNKISEFAATLVILLFIAIIFVAGFITRCATEDINPITNPDNEAQYQSIIESQKDKIEQLQDNIQQHQIKLDSLQLIKQHVKIEWQTKLVTLQGISLTEQHEILSNYIFDVCGQENAGKLFILNVDTFAIYTNDNLQCINSAFIDREFYLEQLNISEDQIAEMQNINDALNKIILHKDTIIQNKDSIITLNKELNTKLHKQNNRLKVGVGITTLGWIVTLFTK